MEPSDYKHVVLGFIFLKYISDAFEAQRAALETTPYADPEDPRKNIWPKTSSAGLGCRKRPTVMERFLVRFPLERIDCLTADREFRGHCWLAYLIQRGIWFRLHIPNHTKTHNRHRKVGLWLDQQQPIGIKKHQRRTCSVIRLGLDTLRQALLNGASHTRQIRYWIHFLFDKKVTIANT